MTNPTTLVDFEGELIGQAGRAGLAVRPTAALESATLVNVNAGSAVSPGSAVVLIEQDAFHLAGLNQASGGINVIGGIGLNSAVMQNINMIHADLEAGKLSGGLINHYCFFGVDPYFPQTENTRQNSSERRVFTSRKQPFPS